MTKVEKHKCWRCLNCDIDGSCIAKQEALFDSFICEHNEMFEFYEDNYDRSRENSKRILLE